MKRIQKVDVNAKIMNLVSDFGIPDYSPSKYKYMCNTHDRILKLVKGRVLYCTKCRSGYLHPNYNWEKDAIIEVIV